MAVYIDIVKQTSNTFNLGVTFAMDLIYVIKKDKSFAIELWIKKNVKYFLLPFDRHIKAAK